MGGRGGGLGKKTPDNTKNASASANYRIEKRQHPDKNFGREKNCQKEEIS